VLKSVPICLISLILIFSFIMPAQAKKDYSHIEIIQGEPKRTYKKLKLLWMHVVKDGKAEYAMKKWAAKLKANAIINYTAIDKTYHGWAVQWTSKSNLEIVSPDDIEIIYGIPTDRKFEVIKELSRGKTKHIGKMNVNKTLAKLKKKAKKLGADAIIDFKVFTLITTVKKPVGDGNLSMILTFPLIAPYIEGTAVRWVK